jgi:hypothetical protein
MSPVINKIYFKKVVSLCASIQITRYFSLLASHCVMLWCLWKRNIKENPKGDDFEWLCFFVYGNGFLDFFFVYGLFEGVWCVAVGKLGEIIPVNSFIVCLLTIILDILYLWGSPHTRGSPSHAFPPHPHPPCTDAGRF